MLNRDRQQQFLALMAERGWDLLLFYGDNWRKDHFRCLVNVNFQGPQAVAALYRSGEVRAIVTDPWDLEPVAEVESFVKANGAEDNFMLVASGGTEVTGMKPPTPRKFKPGDSVTTEL